MQDMKIAVYKDTFAARRGADAAVRLLCDGLRERGHAVALLTDADGDVRARAAVSEVCIAAGTNEMLALTDGGRVRSPVKTVLQFHTHPLYPFRHWIRRWRRCRAIRRAIAFADAVQVLLPSHEEIVRRRIGYSGAVCVIGNASRFETCVPRPGDWKTIICPAALNRDKNQMLLIDAFACVAGEFPEWRIVLYGTGKQSYENKLRERVKTAGLESRVEFAGYVDDLSEAYATCSFVAFPSVNEGFPLAIVDAAAFGKPTVALASTPSVAEMLDSETTGILCGGTVREYADGMARLMRDASLCSRLGEAARRRFAAVYSRTAFLDQWESALKGVAASHK